MNGGSPGASTALEPIERLWEAADDGAARRGGSMPPELRRLYGGELLVPLRADRPTVLANFVTSLDGVVALDPEGGSGGGEISGFFEADRFVMGLLRALADGVLVAAGTVRAAPTHEWTPRRVHRASAPATAAWRLALGLAPQPTTIVVTGSGRLSPGHPGLSAADVPVVIATTRAGARALERVPLARHVRIVPCGDGEEVPPAALLALASDLGLRLVLCEGGPHLFGELVEAGAIDELFLTVAPQLIGRTPKLTRLALIEGVALRPDGPAWSELRSIRRSGSHLFLRYRLGPSVGSTGRRVT